MTGVEPEGTGSWLLAAVLALTLLRLYFLVCLCVFFQFSTEAFASEIMRWTPQNELVLHKSNSVAPGAERNILCTVEIFVPFLSCVPVWRKVVERVGLPSLLKPQKGKLPLDVLPQYPTSVLCGHECLPSSLSVPGFNCVAFDSVWIELCIG